MGISSLPSPSEGMLCIVLVNTALSISIVKALFRSILHIIGFDLPSPSPAITSSDSSENSLGSYDFRFCSPGSCIEEFRIQNPTVRFESVCKGTQPMQDCSVCLSQFQPESEINRLSCGHLFHKACLEKWIDHWNISCPLCRTPLLPEEDVSCCFP